jgi:ribosome-associated protein
VNEVAPRAVAVREEPIRLGQFLKLAGLVASGSEAKVALGAGMIEVNGTEERRRGRQLRRGDEVRCDEQVVVVT